MRRMMPAGVIFALLLVAPARAQMPVTKVPVHMLGPILARSAVTFDTLVNVHALSDGRVVVNDILGRRLVSLDRTLTKMTVIADTSATSPRPYTNETTLLPYVGDSLMLLDFRAAALVVVEPSGRFGRVSSPPKTSDLQNIGISTILGAAGFDQRGRILYASVPLSVIPRVSRKTVPP